jgi:protein arginine N-methyltransferase 2
MRHTGWYEKPGVTVLEGRWQDFVENDVLTSDVFDIIYTDTFSEQYGGVLFALSHCSLLFSAVTLPDLIAFFEHVPHLLKDGRSRLSFFNGLGATSTPIPLPHVLTNNLMPSKMPHFQVCTSSLSSYIWESSV